VSAGRSATNRSERRVDQRQFVDPLADRGQQRLRRPVLIDQQIVALPREPLQALGVHEARLRCLQLVVLPRPRLDRVELGQLKRQPLETRGAFLRRPSTPAGRLAGLVSSAHDGRDRGAIDAGIVVEHVEMGLGIEQPLLLVLAVQVHQPPGAIAQLSGRDGGPVHEGATAPLCRNLAPDHDWDARPGRSAPRSRPAAVPCGRGRRRPARRAGTSTASATIDLPAPVSPVRAVKPAEKSTSTASMTARFRMRMARSMSATELPSYHTFDRIFTA
jgi:hypothetical protein